MYQLCHEKILTQVDLNAEFKPTGSENALVGRLDSVATEEVMAIRFIVGAMIWLDIQFSISAGKAPKLLHYHSSLLHSGSETKLETYVGCKNWVILQIGRIAALHDQKMNALHVGQLDCIEVARTGANIANEIWSGLAQTGWKDPDISEHASTTALSMVSDDATLVTQVFAYAAIIYLHLVIQGFAQLESVNRIISDAMHMLQIRIPSYLLPALVTPLYIVGCTARHEDKDFFRKIFSSLPLLDPSLQHRRRILPVLEEVWSRRRTVLGFSWKDTLSLTDEIMLV